jgi:MtN3 and saliva related transmembrane protein
MNINNTNCDAFCETSGYFGGILASFMFFPQIYKMYKTQKASDISWLTLLLGNISSFSVLYYNYSRNSRPLIITGIISIISRIVILVYKFYIDKKNNELSILPLTIDSCE